MASAIPSVTPAQPRHLQMFLPVTLLQRRGLRITPSMIPALPTTSRGITYREFACLGWESLKITSGMSHYNRICRLFIQAHAVLFFILLVYIKVPDFEDLKLQVPRCRPPQWHWVTALCCQPHAAVLMLFTSFSQKQSLDSVCWKAPVLSSLWFRLSKIWSELNYHFIPIALIQELPSDTSPSPSPPKWGVAPGLQSNSMRVWVQPLVLAKFLKCFENA